jgi:uncharacterized protein (TIGR03000 family)
LDDRAGRARRAARNFYSASRPAPGPDAGQAPPSYTPRNDRPTGRSPVPRLPWLAAALLAALPVALPAQELAKSPILLYVHVPADAKLAVNGVPVSQTGPVRRLITPPLVKGEKGVYTLTLAYTKDGKPVSVEREVTVTGGQDGRVDLTHEEPDDKPQAEPRKDEPKTVPVAPKKDQPKVVPKTDTPPPPPKSDTRPKKDVKLDVPFIETPQAVVEKMLEVAGVKEGDVVYDLGSGDGRIVITAVQKYKARRGVGVELAAARVRVAKDNAEKAGVADKVEIRQGDVLKLKDLSEANVVTLYLLPEVNEKLKPILRKTLKPGARVVSHDFDMGEDWKPEKEVTVKDKDGRDHVVYLWTIKAAKKSAPNDGNIPPIPLKTVPPPKAEPKKDDAPKKDVPAAIRVPYVPTPQSVVDEMLKFAGVKEGDVVYDLGCGDGRIVVTAVKDFKAKKGFGLDIDPQRIQESKQAAKEAKVEDKVEFRQGDVLKLKDVSEATVVTLYLFPEVNEALAPMLKKTLKPGSRIVSHDFLMGDWKPDQQKTVKDAGGMPHDLFLWTIK